MDKTNETYEENHQKSKMIFDVVLFFYQIDSMLKNHNAMLSEKISEGDLISSSIAFNNSLILSNIKRILGDHPEFENYSKSEEFKSKLKDILDSFKTSDKKTDISGLN